MNEYTEGLNNIFRDIGSMNPEEKLAKAKLIFIINNLIKDRQLNSKEAATILNIDQTKISALEDGKLSSFSIDRLFLFVKALDQHIDIVVHNKSQGSHDNKIHIAYA
ncbi:hypothetical protein TI05_11270 [Achromatium sp. WMS3]|nr:hypothetical protein TI05_11270 [Achromatium sp. WMS3]